MTKKLTGESPMDLSDVTWAVSWAFLYRRHTHAADGRRTPRPWTQLVHPAAGPAAEYAAALTSDVSPMLPYVFDVVDVLVTEGPADVDGVVYPDAIEVELSLPVSWTTAVAAGAPEILDGRFIAEVWAWEHERPSLVFALRAVLNP